MIGAEVASHGLGVHRLVIIILVKADGEGLDRPARELLHHCNDNRRIHAAGKESAEGDVGHHLPADGVLQHLFQPVHCCLRRQAERIGGAGPRHLGARPIFLDQRRGCAWRQRQHAARAQL